VVNGTLFNSTKDHWTSVVVERPVDTEGVHVWRVKKIRAGTCGTRARVGVLVRDCEMDMDYQVHCALACNGGALGSCGPLGW
jgi:hypothetical protein